MDRLTTATPVAPGLDAETMAELSRMSDAQLTRAHDRAERMAAARPGPRGDLFREALANLIRETTRRGR